MNNKTVLALVAAIVIVAATPVYAARLEFDCDVPADRYSSVSQDVANSGGVSGAISVNQMRKGNNLPVAGAGIFAPNEHFIAGFQLVAPDTRTKKFDIMFNVDHNGSAKRDKVGEVDASSTITFDVSLSPSGSVVLIVNGSRFQADASAISKGRAMAFCSTAQFKFTNLIFTANGDASGEKP